MCDGNGSGKSKSAAGIAPHRDKRSRIKEKLDKISRVMHDAVKRGLHGKVVVTFQGGTPQQTEVAEKQNL